MEKKLNELIVASYRRYVAERVGEARAQQMPSFEPEIAFAAAKQLAPQYDVGIAVAADGLWLGYFFQLAGLPVKAVKLARKGSGASWQPLDPLNEEDMREKRVIVLENDVVTGRTLERTARELGTYTPSKLDLILIHQVTAIHRRKSGTWFPYFREGVKVVQSDRNEIYLDTRAQVPKAFGQVYGLSDFRDSADKNQTTLLNELAKLH